jgi:hypothetical protein
MLHSLAETQHQELQQRLAEVTQLQSQQEVYLARLRKADLEVAALRHRLEDREDLLQAEIQRLRAVTRQQPAVKEGWVAKVELAAKAVSQQEAAQQVEQQQEAALREAARLPWQAHQHPAWRLI